MLCFLNSVQWTCTEGSGAGGVQTAKGSRKQSSLSGKDSAQVKLIYLDFCGGPLVKNLIANTGEMGLVPALEGWKRETEKEQWGQETF